MECFIYFHIVSGFYLYFVFQINDWDLCIKTKTIANSQLKGVKELRNKSVRKVKLVSIGSFRENHKDNGTFIDIIEYKLNFNRILFKKGDIVRALQNTTRK